MRSSTGLCYKEDSLLAIAGCKYDYEYVYFFFFFISIFFSFIFFSKIQKNIFLITSIFSLFNYLFFIILTLFFIKLYSLLHEFSLKFSLFEF